MAGIAIGVAVLIVVMSVVNGFERELKVMDVTALSLAMENRLPIRVFDISRPGNITRALTGDPIGSLITTEEG